MKKRNIFRTITFRTMLQNRTRTIVTIIGVILSTAMITAVTTFGSSFWGFLVDYAKEEEGNWHVALWEVPQEEAESLQNDENIEAIAEIQELGFAKWENCKWKGNEWGYLRVKSLPEERREMLPIHLESGRMPENDSEILLPWFLPGNEPEDRQTKIGDEIKLDIGTMYTKNGEKVTYWTNSDSLKPGEETLQETEEKTFTVTGFYGSGFYQGTYGDMNGVAFEAFCGPGEKQAQSDVYVLLKRPENAVSFADNIALERIIVHINYDLLRWLGIFDNDQSEKVMLGLLGLVIVIIMVGAVSLIYNAFSISVRERTTQFGLLSSIGATKKQLRRALFYEAVFVCAVGIPIGIICGVVGIGITLHYISFGITALVHGVERQITVRMPVSVLLLTIILAVITVAVSVWVPSGRIRRITPMEAIRASRDIYISPKQVKTGKGILRLLGVPGMLAQKNYKRDRKKYRSTVFSLTMSIVLFVSAMTISNSLQNTGSFVLEAPEMGIELVVYEDALGDQKEAVEKLFLENPQAEKTYMYRTMDQYLAVEPEMVDEHMQGNLLEVDGKYVMNVQCIFVEDEQFAALLKEEGIKTDEYWADGAAKALLLDYRKNYNAQTQRYEKRQIFRDELPGKCESGNLSTTTDLSEAEEEDWASRLEYTVKFHVDAVKRLEKLPEGIVDNYESQPFFILPMCVLERLGEKTAETVAYRFTMKSQDYRGLYEELEKELRALGVTNQGGAYLINLRESYERDTNFVLAVEVLCFGFTALISMIALANVFNTISTNLLLRRREFAMLRSMGFSPKGNRKMLFWESLSYSLRSVLYGAILSAGVSFLTWEIIRIGADNVFYIPWRPIGMAALGVYLMVAGTMILTMRKINKATISDELKLGGM